MTYWRFDARPTRSASSRVAKGPSTTRNTAVPAVTPVTTRAVWPFTEILPASSRACASSSNTAKDTVNSFGVVSAAGVGATAVVSAGAGTTAFTESLSTATTGTESSDAARGRRPFHMNGYQKSAAPFGTRVSFTPWNTTSFPSVTTTE